ncbi:MAG: NFACT family protein [Clostridia bacterium]|nr:NFACT family protein [Clostridia bacterium]
MPFDGFTVAAVVAEINSALSGSRVERVNAPTADEIVLSLRTEDRRTLKLCLSASSNIPKVNITSVVKDNPVQASALCMHLRKHLNSARLVGASQPGFERVIKLEFSASDELGYPRTEFLFAEIMGKYSNVILTDGDGKIINCVKPVDITTSSKRQVLPGMAYEAPPPQDKLDPTEATADDFAQLCDAYGELDADSFFVRCFRGFSPLMSRETATLAGASGKPVKEHGLPLYRAFRETVERCRAADFCPCIVYDGKKPVDFSVFEIKQYGAGTDTESFDSISECIDVFYRERENSERIKQRGGDVLRIVNAAETHIKKKIANIADDLGRCDDADKYRVWADLLTANLYRIEKGAASADVEDFYSDDGRVVTIPLDPRISASANAQKYYKKYTKSKTAKTELGKRAAAAEAELQYIRTVADALGRSETEEDLDQIRQELYETGYASKMKDARAKKPVKQKPMQFLTDGGYTVYVGRNNTQNDRLTMKDAGRYDWFFHVKNAPGSHVIMVVDGEEPPAQDFTQAARLAAYYSSKRGGENVEVDYTQVKNIKKPAGSVPGFVIYSQNYSATVTPDPGEAERLRVDKDKK